MRRKRRGAGWLVLAAVLVLGAGLAEAQVAPGRVAPRLMRPAERLPTLDAYLRAPIRPSIGARDLTAVQGRTAVPGLSVLARDLRSDLPSLLIAPRLPRPAGIEAMRPEARARAYLRALAPAYGLTPPELETARIRHLRRDLGGSTVAVFEQRIEGLEVLGARLSLLIDRRGALVAAGGALRARAGVQAPPFLRSEEDSFAVALADRWGRTPAGTAGDASLVQRVTGSESEPEGAGEYARYELSARGQAAGYALRRPARVRRVLFALPRHVVPAHYLELWVPAAGRSATVARRSELWAYVVSAEDGALLLRQPLTRSERFSYRVYAEGSGRSQPWDSPYGDTTPDATGAPLAVGDVPPWRPAALVSMEAFNANPAGGVDPWLAAGATESRGNNVDAYADLGGADGFDAGDRRASVTAAGSFDHVYDALRQPDESDTQIQAVVTNLFYVNNWLHDYFYDLGFDEAAGNAQQSNFGRGGAEGDPLHAEALDFSGYDNADMSTPADGESPVMQMYRWGAASGVSDWGLTVGAESFPIGTADFGPYYYDVSAPTVLVDDGVGPNRADGCEPITNDLSGRIALVDRGGCDFDQKALEAEARGAVGVIVMDNEAGPVFDIVGEAYVDIPVILVRQVDGARLRGALLGREARMYWLWESVPSSFDNEVVSHEWGHYLHGRLLPICGSQQCGVMGEGWGDFISLLTLMRQSDDLDGAYPSAAFSGQGYAPIYFGTRRVPYSRNRDFNDLSFRHISDGEPLPDTHPFLDSGLENSEVHDAGEIWTTMLFDGLLGLIERARGAGAPYDFEGARERMAGYIVTGMEMSPRTPTITEQRDAILLAAHASDPEDARILAEAFAGRGAGSCAVSPPRESIDLIGVEEHFEVGSIARLLDMEIALTDALRCDADEVLDGGEGATIRVTVENAGLFPLTGASVRLSADSSGVELVGGGSASVPELAPGERAELSLEVVLSESAPPAGPVTFTATVDNPDCPGASSSLFRRVPIDRDPGGASETEAFEEEPPWVVEIPLDPISEGIWEVGPSELGDPDLVLRGHNAGYLSDSAVEIPEFRASSSEPLVVSFMHRFDFEADDATYWDGAVIELSTDGGESWEDVSTRVDPGYSGRISDESDNPLGEREVYSGRNPSFPSADTVTLDFGMALAGQDVRVRFRVGNDSNTGYAGWEIDDLAVTGAEAPVFPAWLPDEATCADRPDGGVGRDAGPGRRGGGDGCGCVVPGRSEGHDRAGLLLALALGLLLGRGLLRRRRARRRA